MRSIQLVGENLTARVLKEGLRNMRISCVEDLPTEATRAVIINVGTEAVSTLALASAVAYSSMPILVIDCDPTPEGSLHFEDLMAEWGFDLLDSPRRAHGDALDDLFLRINADRVLLLDSDAEIRDADLVKRMRDQIDNPVVFGAGFVDGPSWMGQQQGCSPHTGLFQERPWMPCVLFRTSDVRKALAAGRSFRTHVIYNDLMFSRRISRLLARRFQNDFVPRSRIVEHLPRRVRRRLRDQQLRSLEWVRRDFYGLRPNFVYCDTGAAIYQWCKYENGGLFAGAPAGTLKDEVFHYSGVTRCKLDPRQVDASRLVDIEKDVRGRLFAEYDLRLPDGLAPMSPESGGSSQ